MFPEPTIAAVAFFIVLAFLVFAGGVACLAVEHGRVGRTLARGAFRSATHTRNQRNATSTLPSTSNSA